MAQTSAAREPSMEEILASIRRIIETNDGGAAEAERPEAEAQPHLAPVETAAPEVTPQARSAEHERAAADLAERARQAVAAAPTRTISLADVAARLRSAPEAAPPAPAAVVEQEVRRETVVAPVADNAPDEDEAQDAFDAEDSGAEDGGDRSAALWSNAADEESEADEPEAAVITLAVPPVADERPAPIPGRAESDSPPPSPVPSRASQGELISQAAGAKVAAAFEDLNEAVIRGQMRSFDAIAEDMLRPMLKDWLDDNLPTLVERLVREEIERVARGGRR